MRSMPIRVLQILGQVNNGSVEVVVMNYLMTTGYSYRQGFVPHKFRRTAAVFQCPAW